jgi:hypothetical protein
MTDDTAYEAAIRRKADALEAANGDPAKIAELRFQLPHDRRSLGEVQHTATATVPLDDTESKPKAATAKPVPEVPAKPKLAATRGIRTAAGKTTGK